MIHTLVVRLALFSLIGASVNTWQSLKMPSTFEYQLQLSFHCILAVPRKIP